MTETWLTDSIFDNEILPPHFTIYRKDRGSRGGGVLIAIKDSIPSNLLSSPSHLEVLAVVVGSNHPITLCIVYAPPTSTYDYYQSLFTYLSDLVTSGSQTIIVGDFIFSLT